MEQTGLLTSHHDVVDGRQRRPYRATEHGHEVLATCHRALVELAGEILTEGDLIGSDDSRTRALDDTHWQ